MKYNKPEVVRLGNTLALIKSGSSKESITPADNQPFVNTTPNAYEADE